MEPWAAAMRDFAEESLSKNASSYASKIVVDMATASSCQLLLSQGRGGSQKDNQGE